MIFANNGTSSSFTTKALVTHKDNDNRNEKYTNLDSWQKQGINCHF